MNDKIQEQTQALADQLKKLDETKTDEEYKKELEVYNQMLKEADFSIESQAASKKFTIVYKVFASPINWTTGQVNKVNKKLIEHNRRGKNK